LFRFRSLQVLKLDNAPTSVQTGSTMIVSSHTRIPTPAGVSHTAAPSTRSLVLLSIITILPL